jgi:uncharacterized membrane protein
MQLPPLLFIDLGFLFLFGSVFILITMEMLSFYYGQSNIMVNLEKMRVVVYVVVVLFSIIATIQLILLMV